MGSSRSDDDDGGAGHGGGHGGHRGYHGHGRHGHHKSGHGSGGSHHHHLAVPGEPPPGSGHAGGGGGHGSGHRPYSPVAETLFRKDLISAMKLPDNEPLTADDYLVVTDTWKQEWERGVQVPVKPEQLPEPRVSRLAEPPQSANRFSL